MTQGEYSTMIDMLKSATLKKKIVWTEDEGNFVTNVGGCNIELASSYDYQINLHSYSLKLSNRDGIVFNTYSYSEDVDVDDYQCLKRLYECIRDMNYKVSESEQIILSGLKDLLKQDDDNLPF